MFTLQPMKRLKNRCRHTRPKAGGWLKSNVWTILLAGMLLTLWLSKDTKAFAIRGLIHTGILGRPVIEQASSASRRGYNGQSNQSVTFAQKSSAPMEAILQNEHGQTFKLSDLRGKVVFINFWATWCPPCRAEMPGIRDLKMYFAKDTAVVFLLVDVDGKLKQSGSYLRRRDLGQLLNVSAADSLRLMPRSLQENSLVKMVSPIPAELEAGSVPASFVLDRKGKIVMRYIGAADYMHPAFLKAFKQFVSQ